MGFPLCGVEDYLLKRTVNLSSGLGWRKRLSQERLKTLGLSQTRLFNTNQTGSINSLALDATEQRYLLSGAADASVAIFDTQSLGRTYDGLPLDPVCLAGRSTPGGHQFMVSSVAWYPLDTGMFITGSYDQDVKCWDANMMEVVCTFCLPAKVAAVAMSHIATTHCLIAAGCHEPLLRLCDPATGAFTHTLVGHKDPIWSVAWSYRSEYELVSGDTRGQVRVWDIRRFGSLHVLDHYATVPPRVLRQQQRQQQQQQLLQTSSLPDPNPLDLPRHSPTLSIPPGSHTLTAPSSSPVSPAPSSHQPTASAHTLPPLPSPSSGSRASVSSQAGMLHSGLPSPATAGAPATSSGEHREQTEVPPSARGPLAAAVAASAAGRSQARQPRLSMEEAVDAAWACLASQQQQQQGGRDTRTMGSGSKRPSIELAPPAPRKRTSIDRSAATGVATLSRTQSGLGSSDARRSNRSSWEGRRQSSAGAPQQQLQQQPQQGAGQGMEVERVAGGMQGMGSISATDCQLEKGRAAGVGAPGRGRSRGRGRGGLKVAGTLARKGGSSAGQDEAHGADLQGVQVIGAGTHAGGTCMKGTPGGPTHSSGTHDIPDTRGARAHGSRIPGTGMPGFAWMQHNSGVQGTGIFGTGTGTGWMQQNSGVQGMGTCIGAGAHIGTELDGLADLGISSHASKTSSAKLMRRQQQQQQQQEPRRLFNGQQVERQVEGQQHLERQRQQQEQEQRRQQELQLQEQRQQQHFWAFLGSTNSHTIGTLAPVPLQASQRGAASRGLIGGHAPTARSLLARDGELVEGHGGLQEEVVRSHQGACTSVTPTPDGLHWLTSGTDDRLRLWDALDWHHWLVAYPETRNKSVHGRQCAVTADGAAVFHPSGSVIQVFEVSTGRLLNQLQNGHLSSVNALAWNPDFEELYSGCNDGQILTWAPGLKQTL